VGGGADLVVWLRVRRELATTLRAAPLLCRGDQRSADPTATGLWHDEPSLEIRDTVAEATFGVRTNGEFGEAHRTSRSIVGQEDSERFPRVAGEETLDLLVVLGFGTLGPESVAQLKPRHDVGRLGKTNRGHGIAAA